MENELRPKSPVPTNAFSVRWTGYLKVREEGDHVLYVNVNAGSRVRVSIDSGDWVGDWNEWEPVQLEFAMTNFLYTNGLHAITLEYKNTSTAPRIQLSWIEPGSTNRAVIPRSRFYGLDVYRGATGISIDAAGKIWAGCYDSSVAVRIDPNEGDEVVVGGVTNRVGAVDMVVDLGDGSASDPHEGQYKVAADPYNYSDMTGFNVRVVNPGLQPLKGYWVAVDDSGNAGQLWNKVAWSADLTNGCSIEVYVRAADERTDLGSTGWLQVTNGVEFPSLRGRYLEVRLGMTREDASKEPVVHDLTLYGTSSGFVGDFFLYDAWADEGGDGVFWTDLAGAEPMSYQWFRACPWETNWVQVPGGTNSYFVITNVDSWVDLTMAKVLVTNGNGESLWLGPAYLVMFPAELRIPAINYPSGQGPGTRYPATINVFGQPTNIATTVVTVSGLSHTRTADLSILLVSPSDKRIMLMSNAGGTNGTSGATLIFQQGQPVPPGASAIPSFQVSFYSPYNWGQETQLPGAPAGPYSSNLHDLYGDNPNGSWKLYIYDDQQPGGIGELTGSWFLDFTFQ